MATRKVPVTSVTPASKVTAVSKAQQARTRNLVMGIASVTPVGRVAKGAATAAKVVSRSTKTGKAITARVAENKANMASQVGEWSKHPGYASAKSNARIQQGKWSSDKQIARYQRQEAKQEIKGNARGLKAAQKPTNKTGSAADRADRARLQGQANVIKNATPARANRTRGGSLAAMKAYGGQGVATAKLTPKQAAARAEINRVANRPRSK